ncbi:MAG: hypothetical protein PV344_06755, partial [Anaplasma sp.]|nr:hypothetical protein [Anaplasma sp.]
EFRTTHNAHVKRDVTRGMKVTKRRNVLRNKGRRMSHMISLYRVIHLPYRKNLKNVRQDSNPRRSGCEADTVLRYARHAWERGVLCHEVVL